MSQDEGLVTLLFLGAVVLVPLLVFLFRFFIFWWILKRTPIEERTGLSPVLSAFIAAIGYGSLKK